jgi:hypothetical protein
MRPRIPVSTTTHSGSNRPGLMVFTDGRQILPISYPRMTTVDRQGWIGSAARFRFLSDEHISGAKAAFAR